jgi:hypothetical protein
VTYIKTVDSAGVVTTLTAGVDYLVDTNRIPGRIVLPYQKTWPSLIPYPIDPIQIRAVCGFNGTTGSTLWEQYKTAILFHIGVLYRCRDEEVPADTMKIVNMLYQTNKSSYF